MSTPPKTPADCADMADVRAGIDAVDLELVALLARRMAYIDRAAAIKRPLAIPARIDWRVDEVVAKVREAAVGEALDPNLAEGLWRQLIEWSIAREERVLGKDSRE